MKKSIQKASLGWALLILALCSGCTDYHDGPEYAPDIRTLSARASSTPIYRFAVPPEGSARRQWHKYHLLIEEINRGANGFRVRFETAQYENLYRKNLTAGLYDLALIEPNEVDAFQKLKYALVAKVASEDSVTGVLVARLDADIEYLLDLKGKRLAFAGERQVSTMLVRLFVRPDVPGLDRVVKCLYTASDASAFLTALNGNADAAAGSLRGWTEFAAAVPDAEKTLELKWQTHALSGPAFMSHPRVARADVATLADVLWKLRRTQAGRAALERTGLHGFTRASSRTYGDVRSFLRSYARAFPSQRKELAP